MKLKDSVLHFVSSADEREPARSPQSHLKELCEQAGLRLPAAHGKLVFFYILQSPPRPGSTTLTCHRNKSSWNNHLLKFAAQPIPVRSTSTLSHKHSVELPVGLMNGPQCSNKFKTGHFWTGENNKRRVGGGKWSLRNRIFQGHVMLIFFFF